ncbi:MAG TPA: hypothetical protein VFI47_07905 [Acidimicrobiales bacterium]|nr:hypothetical protein [Acidimicrobiales bacterium]
MVAALAAACTAGAESGGSGCAPSDIPDHDDRTIVIEGDPWSGYALFRDPDLLDGTGYTSLYVEQLCQDVRAADLSAGRAGIEVTTLDQYVLNRPDGVVVGVIDQSEGADALVLNTVDVDYLRTVDDLPRLVDDFRGRDRRPVLAYTGNSPSQMLLDELANTYDELRLSEFDLVSVDQSATAYQMMVDHEAQVAVVWEPDTSAAQAAGYTVALSSEDVPDSIVDVIVAGRDLVDRDPDAVAAVVSAFYTRMDGLLASPDDLERLIAEDGGLDRQAAESVIAGIKLYGSGDADAFMNDSVFPLDQPQVDQSINAIGAVLALVHPDVDPGRAETDGSFVHNHTTRAGGS